LVCWQHRILADRSQPVGRIGLDWIGSGQVRSGQVRSGQVRSTQKKSLKTPHSILLLMFMRGDVKKGEVLAVYSTFNYK